jgi:hypothetical protein
MPWAAGAMLGPIRSQSGRLSPQSDKLIFYIAGTRFYKTDRSAKTGEDVSIRRETFEGEVCYGVYNQDGSQIGYVPKEIVSILETRGIVKARVISTREFGVPWHRYKVCLNTVAACGNVSQPSV